MQPITRIIDKPLHNGLNFLYWFLAAYGMTLIYLKIKALHLGLANADISLYQNILWNTHLDGMILYSDFLFFEYGYRSYLTEHFAPTLALLVPLYKLWSSPYLLLLLQALAPVITARLLFTYALHIKLPKNIAILAIVSYCVHPTVVMGTLDIGNGFHHDALIPPLLLASLILFKSPHFLLYYGILILTLGLKENVPFTVMVAAAIAFFTTEAKKRSIVTGGLALIFIVMALYITPELYNVKPQHALGIIDRITTQEVSLSSAVATLWANKELFWYLSAFLAPLTLLIILPELAMYHFSSYQSYIFDWHGLPSVTVVVVASMAGFTSWKTLTAGLGPNFATRLFVLYLVAIIFVGSAYSLAKSRNLIFPALSAEQPSSAIDLNYFKEIETLVPEWERFGSQYAYWPYSANRQHQLLSEHAHLAEYLFIDVALLDVNHDAPLVRLIIHLLNRGKITTLVHESSRFFLFKVDDRFNHNPPENFLLSLTQVQLADAKNAIVLQGENLYSAGIKH